MPIFQLAIVHDNSNMLTLHNMPANPALTWKFERYFLIATAIIKASRSCTMQITEYDFKIGFNWTGFQTWV